MSDTQVEAEPWANRIVEYAAAVDPATLAAHPENWRGHPDAQRMALTESLGRVGWVGAVLVNSRSGRIIDGHERVDEAARAGGTVPVLWVDLDEDEERFVLASFDTIGAMADVDAAALAALLDHVDVDSPALADALAELSAATDTPEDVPPKAEPNVAELEPPANVHAWVTVPFAAYPQVAVLLEQIEAIPGVKVRTQANDR